MLKVFQLMIALPLDWLTITEELPWPEIVAEPPTTVPPLGPAATGAGSSSRPNAEPSASSAVVVSSRLRERGCIAMVPLELGAEDEEEPRILSHALVEALRHRRRAGQALALDDLCD